MLISMSHRQEEAGTRATTRPMRRELPVTIATCSVQPIVRFFVTSDNASEH